jgi:glycosyltransferase involved in cell wall biosynthesis
MTTISAVMLARNEELNIRYCLETIRWCDEIVVVDMDSSDKTAEIAREFTNKVFFHEKILAFDIAKKFGVIKRMVIGYS